MTAGSAALDAIARLAAATCRAPSPEALTEVAGAATDPGRHWTDGRGIPRPIDAAFARLEILPWTAGRSGYVHAEFAPGAGPSLAQLRDRLSLRPLPMVGEGPPECAADWSEPGAPATCLIVVEEPLADADPVDAILIRRNPDGAGA